MKESKYAFGMRYVEYLGHVVGCGVQAVPEYCSKALQDYQKPRTRKQLRSFISAMSYYPKFIPGFAHFFSVQLQLPLGQRIGWSGGLRRLIGPLSLSTVSCVM